MVESRLIRDLETEFKNFADEHGLKAFIPKRSFTTDNAAMVAVAGYFKYLNKDFCSLDLPPYARVVVVW